MLLAKYCTVTITSVMPWRLSRLRICSMTGLPAIGTIGLGRRIVNGLSLDPSPPAMTTAFIAASLDIEWVALIWRRRSRCHAASIVQHRLKVPQVGISTSHLVDHAR